MKRISYKFAIVIALLAGAYGLFLNHQPSRYEPVDRYRPVDATVTAIEELCSLHKFESDGITNSAILTSASSCEDIKEHRRSDPRLRDAEVSRATYVNFRYISPADGRPYPGSFNETRHADGSLIRVGDRLPILAHKTDPPSYRPPV